MNPLRHKPLPYKLVEIWNIQGESVSRPPSKVYDSTSMAAPRKIMQPILRTVHDGVLVHCYLACGHLITLRKEDMHRPSPSEMECWACEEEQTTSAHN